MQKQFDLLNNICSIFFSAPEKFNLLEYEYKLIQKKPGLERN